MKIYMSSFFLGVTIAALLSNFTHNFTERSKIKTELVSKSIKCTNYLPMNVGNYWEYSSNSHTKITSVVKIDDHSFYVFSSVIGGDMIETEYLRLDEDCNLVGILPESKQTYTKAKFESEVGEVFKNWSEEVNAYRIETIYKDEDSITFEWTLLDHFTQAGTTHTETYRCGVGFKSKFAVISGDTINAD